MTSFGERILPLIGNVLSAEDELTKGAREGLNPSYKIIRIGLTPLIDTRIVASAVQPFHRHSGVDFVFKECYLGDLQHRLLEGTLDLVFRPAGVSDKRIGRRRFYDEELFYLPRNPTPEQKEGLGPVRLEQIASETFALTVGCGLADSTRKIFQQYRLRLREYPGQALSYKVLEDWAGLGVASAIVPRSRISAANRIARPLHDANGPVLISYEMAWNRRADKPRHVQDFLSYFQVTAKGIVRGLAQAYVAS